MPNDNEDTCEVCGATPTPDEPLVICEGALVCGGCAKKHGLTLARYRDDLREDLFR